MRRLKWRTSSSDVSRATCGGYDCEVDWDADAGWTYSVEASYARVREFGDYIKSFGTQEAAQEACERWLIKQTKRQMAALKLNPKEKKV